MKKLLVIMLSLSVTLGAAAQHRIGGGFRGGSSFHGGVVHYSSPRVTVIAPYAPIYPSFGYGLGLGFGYSPFYDPFYSQRYESRPSQLDLQIEDIKNDYDYKIATAKHDDSLSKDERKQKVRDLKHEKDQEIIDAKKNYYSSKNDYRHNNNRSDNKTSDNGNSDNENSGTE